MVGRGTSASGRFSRPGENLKSCVSRVKESMDVDMADLCRKANSCPNGCLFSNDSCIHLTPDQFTFIGGTHHSLSEWDPEKKDALEMSAENIRKTIGDKESAREKCRASWDIRSLWGIRVTTEEAYRKVKEHFEFMRWYVRGFRLTARGYCFGRYVRGKDGNDVIAEGKTAAALLEENIQEMERYREKLCAMPLIHTYPFDAQLNPERVDFYIHALKEMSGGNER